MTFVQLNLANKYRKEIERCDELIAWFSVERPPKGTLTRTIVSTRFGIKWCRWMYERRTGETEITRDELNEIIEIFRKKKTKYEQLLEEL